MSTSHPRSVLPTTENHRPSMLNPRRPPAHRSVSLRHSPRVSAQRSSMIQGKSGMPGEGRSNSNSNDQASTKAENSEGSPSSLRPLNGRGSSGESSNADKWFDQSNNDVRDASTSYADNDPPFFMRNGSSSTSPNDQLQRLRQYMGHDGTQSLPLRTGMMNLGTDAGSSAEDFRGVIDDLTVENKKLKRRLKKYEKLHDAHLKNEKLFEIRVHGLEPDKKRELEELLRDFAGGLSSKSGQEFPANGYEGIMPVLKTQNTASSQASVHNTDSAYASMSASGQGSSAPSGGDSKPRHTMQAAKSRQQNIHSYLHHIPEGLLPHHNPEALTERAKKKMVVRRLEQIFAGTAALAGPHHQALQQQDVSQMAASADRSAVEAKGQQAVLEGLRESAIMEQETEDPLDIGKKRRTAPTRSDAIDHQETEKAAEHDFAPDSLSTSSEEQRPTRPLDLDPDRAQVPAENLHYIRHLGFSPQDPAYSPQDDHGWVYLNLLVNMAQLHTIHVTPEFVRKAVTECSDHFEVSEDGRKVRWRGGSRITKTSSYGGGSSRERTDEDEAQSPRKRMKLVHANGLQNGKLAPSSQRKHDASARKSHMELGRLMYTPLFSHRSSSNSDASSSNSDLDEDSPFNTNQVGGDSSAMTSSGVRTTSTRRNKYHDNGPIIFYNNAQFCTDLSGDSRPDGNINAPKYKAPCLDPVGRTPACETPDQILEKRGPLEEASMLPEPMDLADNPIPDSLELAFPRQSPPHRKDEMHVRPEIDLEVTGMGGVYPADNFAITVESRHAMVDQAEAPAVPIQSTSKKVPDRFAKILQSDNPQRNVRAAIAHQYLNIQRTEHPPSVLPPALCFMPEDDSMSDVESSQAEDMSISPISADDLPPSTAPQTMGLHYAISGGEDEEMGQDEDEGESDAESDDSLDLLATARKADPDAVQRKERQYDAEMAERLAEEIPAGSSAATAGGGSGFASPASGFDKREYRQAKQEARMKQQSAVAVEPPTLKRARTSDSMDVHGLEGSEADSSSSSEDDDDDDDDRSGS
ncbi:hypothetical protein Q7P37_006492 [Cladosporium fusiforme]